MGNKQIWVSLWIIDDFWAVAFIFTSEQSAWNNTLYAFPQKFYFLILLDVILAYIEFILRWASTHCVHAHKHNKRSFHLSMFCFSKPFVSHAYNESQVYGNAPNAGYIIKSFDDNSTNDNEKNPYRTFIPSNMQ